jgi:hypothetical protein
MASIAMRNPNLPRCWQRLAVMAVLDEQAVAHAAHRSGRPGGFE